MFGLRKKIFFDRKPKMTKTIGFENLKILQNGQISEFGIFKFSNSIFFDIFGFPTKKIVFLKASILLCYQKHFGADSINRKEDKL